MKLIITIDTEEDNRDNYISSGYTLNNLKKISNLQELFDEFGVRPTYLITYPVATDEAAISMFRYFLEEGRCEIGTHCHPWNTPPFEEETSQWNSMLCNLPVDLQLRKLTTLHETIIRNFGITPISFRAGRWGYSGDVAVNLHKLGYKVETSVTPYTNWTNYGGPDFSDYSPNPFRFSSSNAFSPSNNGQMLQVPVTIGFLQKNFTRTNSIIKMAGKRPLKSLRVIGILSRLGFANKVWLSPEVALSEEMIRLSQRMFETGYPILNFVFHSTSLKAGIGPFVKTEEDERRFLQTIREFLVFIRNAGIPSIKLSEAYSLI